MPVCLPLIYVSVRLFICVCGRLSIAVLLCLSVSLSVILSLSVNLYLCPRDWWYMDRHTYGLRDKNRQDRQRHKHADGETSVHTNRQMDQYTYSPTEGNIDGPKDGADWLVDGMINRRADIQTYILSYIWTNRKQTVNNLLSYFVIDVNYPLCKYYSRE